jgi:hypothetical protein
MSLRILKRSSLETTSGWMLDTPARAAGRRGSRLADTSIA